MKGRSTHLGKEQIHHLLRAAASMTNRKSFTMIGTGAAIAQLRNVPLALMMTREIDIYVTDASDQDTMADLIDGSMGEGSQFDLTHGYYAHGVGPRTACLPDDWRDRAITMAILDVPGGSFTCPEINDVALSKLCAWREKDLAWLKAAVNTGVVDIEAMKSRAGAMGSSNAPAADEMARRLEVLQALKESSAAREAPGTSPGNKSRKVMRPRTRGSSKDGGLG